MALPKQDSELITKLRRWVEDSRSSRKAFSGQVLENLDFFSGIHWSSADENAARDDDKALITVNQVFKFLIMMTGVQIQGRQDARAFPVGRGADPIVADLISLAIKSVDYETFSHYVQSEMYMNGQIADRAYMKWQVGYRNGFPMIRQSAPHPLDIFEDPNGRTYTLEDGHKYIFERLWFPQDQVLDIYGSNKQERKIIEEQLNEKLFREDDLFFRTFGTEEQVAIMECQFRQFERVQFAVHKKNGRFVPDVKDKEINELINVGFNVFLDGRPTTRFVRFTGNLILENKEHYLPDGQFSHSRYSPYFAMGRDVSMVTQLKVQQKELNSWRSMMHELVKRAPKGTILYTDQSGLSDTDAENLSVLGGAFKVADLTQIMIPDMTGYYSGLPAMNQQVQYALKEFQDITGITDVLLGQLKSSTSGVVFSRAVNQAIVGMRMGLDNFQRTLLMHYKKLVPIVQNFFPRQKLLRLSDDQYRFLEKAPERKKFQQFLVPQDEDEQDLQPENANFLPDADGKGELELLNKYNEAVMRIPVDVSIGEYDIRMDFAQTNVTNIAANFELSIQLLQAMPQIAPHIIDLIVDMAPFPNKSVITERLKQARDQILAAQQQQSEVGNMSQVIDALSKISQNGSEQPQQSTRF